MESAKNPDNNSKHHKKESLEKPAKTAIYTAIFEIFAVVFYPFMLTPLL
jgi:hypothetical protein